MVGKKGFATLSPLGSGTIKAAAPKDAEINFALFAPKAKSVAVAGSFNNWNTNASKLKKDSNGTWTGSVRLKPGRYEYLFCVDGGWLNDPKARETVSNPFGTINSVITVR